MDELRRRRDAALRAASICADRVVVSITDKQRRRETENVHLLLALAREYTIALTDTPAPVTEEHDNVSAQIEMGFNVRDSDVTL